MIQSKVSAVLLTSMHNIAYYSGFLYCSFGRPYACVVTAEDCITISANIDLSQPWRRSFGDNIIYTDWKRDNYWRAVKHAFSGATAIGIESDHMTLMSRDKLDYRLEPEMVKDLSSDIMLLRMIKSDEEIELIKGGARVADIGGAAIRDAIRVGAREIDEHFASLDLLDYRTFGYGHSFGVLSHYYGREAGLELREDIDTILEPNMVVSIEPMLTIPEGTAGAGGYREHDILVVTKEGSDNITGFPYGPEHNVII